MELSEKKQAFISSSGHQLALGGPGCGKTTSALLKAARYIDGGSCKPWQKVLFLSFARATVARVAEQATGILDQEVRNQLDLSTYHSFAWNILKSHGYLLFGREPFIRTAEQAGVLAESVLLWCSRARRDDVDGTTVLVPQAADLFLLMLAEHRGIQAQYAMFFAASLLLLHGPFHLADAELSPYQQERLAQAAALAIHHAADELERLTAQIGN